MTGHHYSGQLKRLRESIKEKRPRKFTRGILFHQDNAPVHTSVVFHGNNSRLQISTCPYPPYLPDLAPSDFHLFPQMKKSLAGCHFASDDVIIAVEEFFKSQTKELFYTGIKALQHRGSKCSALEGDYVEK